MFRIGDECFHNAFVWTHENRISSDGNTREICLPWLPEGATELIGHLVNVDGKTKLNGIFKYDPFRPGTKVTNDQFDQIVLYNTLQSVPKYLMDMGFNVTEVIFKRRGGNFKITGHANATTALNAWYSPQTGEMTFGTDNDKWHLASDSDVSAHEEGHLILDHYNPGLTGWFSKEGGAIHEGYADALAALYFDDPHMSEDFVPSQGRPENKDDGLRIVDNDLTLEQAGKEVHARGRAYAGFFWSIKKTLSDPNGPFRLSSREAADVTLKLLVNHGGGYFTSRPEPKDFIEAVLGGMERLAKEGRLGVDKNLLWNVIIAEGKKRGMLVADDKKEPPAIFSSMAALNRYLSTIGGKNMEFYKSHETETIGGKTEYYQQQIKTQRFGKIDIVGSTLIVQKDGRGRIIAISARDVIPVDSKAIDERGGVDLEKAIENSLGQARMELQITSTKMKQIQYLRSRLPAKEVSKAQMDQEIARTDYQNLTKMKQTLNAGRKPNHKIVMIEGGDVPHYELKVGLSIYYVNTINGEVTRYKDVLVD